MTNETWEQVPFVRFAETDKNFSSAINSVFDRLKLLGTGAPGNKTPYDHSSLISWWNSGG